ncbi:unnamed protein product [Urochloa decumbens]|uniref:Uncharacterized protein n=1 Tax=Urochloa decumbens TaxID=240449 RepID=A0ABC8YGS2_9POAL
MATSMTSTHEYFYGRCKAPPILSSMAALKCYCLSSTATIVQRRKSSRTLMIRASMDACSSSESKKSLKSASFTGKVNSNKVYEDKNMGILCYTDENGELVCEGLDEGPRLTWQDMEKLNMEKKEKHQGGQRQSTLPIAGGTDWSSLLAAVSLGKN